jgi:3-dehydrotetronate 4-kinase
MGRTIAHFRGSIAVEGLIDMLLGCIADDYTGATDLASMLVKHGMRTVQYIGMTPADEVVTDADAEVVTLKLPAATVRRAASESVTTLAGLRAAGCRQAVLKYCSTFDSTDAGNIGLVADALPEALGVGFALACPAFPLNVCSVYKGYLFVGGVLLNESGLENHPLTPMRDADLVRVLSRQPNGTVGLVPYAVVEQGGAVIRGAMTALAEQGWRYAIVDSVNDVHLVAVGKVAAAHALITGGSGVAMGLPAKLRRAGLLLERADPGALQTLAGAAAALTGSCSHATLGQLDFVRAYVPVFDLDLLVVPDAAALAASANDWASQRLGATPIVIAASAPPEKVATVRRQPGADAADVLIEGAMARIATGLVLRDVRRLVVAGGEASGALVSGLGVRNLRIDGEIDPGVPWTCAEGGEVCLLLALKSGNFGGRDFFLKALGVLD